MLRDCQLVENNMKLIPQKVVLMGWAKETVVEVEKLVEDKVVEDVCKK